MTHDELIRSLETLDLELHSARLVAYYRGFDHDVRERFVGLRAYVAVALADARRARIEDLSAALEEHDAELRDRLDEVNRWVRDLSDAARTLDVVGDVLTALSRLVPGILNGVLP